MSNKPLCFSFVSALTVTVMLLALGAAPLYAGTPGHSVNATEYIALRRQKRCDASLSYRKVQADPTLYIGKVMELAGKVAGSSSNGETVSIELVLAEDASTTLDLPVSAMADIQDDPTGRLRVLVQVGDPGNSNLAPLKVLGFAHEGDVRLLEQQEGVKEEAARLEKLRRQQSEERWKKEAQRAVEYGNRRQTAVNLPASAAANEYATGLSERARPLFWAYYNFIAQTNSRLDTAAISSITFHLLNFADRYNVDPRLIVAMILAESHFNPNATSRSGAMGLGQLMPGTAKALGVDNPYDPVENLGGSINYLRSRLDTFADHALPGGGLSFEQAALALAAYNAGANAVKKYNGVPPYTQTQAYVRKVISYYQQLCR